MQQLNSAIDAQAARRKAAELSETLLDRISLFDVAATTTVDEVAILPIRAAFL